MKKFNITSVMALALMLGFSSCQSDEYVEPEFATKSFGVYASFFNHSNGGANLNPTLLTTNMVEGIKDISNGELSHTWSFLRGSDATLEDGTREWSKVEKGGGVTFIKKNAGLGYASLEDYSEYVDNSINPTNNLSDITFFFDKGGAYKLVINNTYDNRVRYMYSEYDDVLKLDITRYLESEPMANGKHQIVREYEFEVFEPLTPTVELYKDASKSQKIDLDDCSKIMIEGIECAEITINAGESLYLHDATGENENGVSSFFTAPSSRKWTWFCTQAPDGTVGIPTVSPFSSAAQDQLFTFDKAGCYRASLNVVRSKPSTYSANAKFPTATATETLPIVVNVL